MFDKNIRKNIEYTNKYLDIVCKYENIVVECDVFKGVENGEICKF